MPHMAQPAPSTPSAFQDVEVTVARALKCKAQERQVGGERGAGRGGNLLALGWERHLAANLLDQ